VDFEDDTLNYTLELGTEDDPADWDSFDAGPLTEISVGVLPDAYYHWRIMVEDGIHSVYSRDGHRNFFISADNTPTADSAEAFDMNSQSGIQDGDYVAIRFSEPLDPACQPTAAQLDAALPLSNGHTWLDGSGGVQSIALSETVYPSDTLLIYLSTTNGTPTVFPGDTVDFDNSSGQLVDHGGNSIGGQVIISGSFGPGDVPVFDTDWSFIDTLDYEGTNTLSCRIDPDNPADSVDVLIADGGSDSFETFDMTYNTDGVWSWDVDSDYLSLTGILYAFSAINADGNALYPADYPASTLAARLAFQNLTGPLELPPGNDVTDYRLVSIPALLDNPDANAQFADDFGQIDGTRWRLFVWDPNNEEYYEYGIGSPDYLAPGGGFWLITKDGCSEISIHDGVGLPLDEEFTITVYAGWNLIGNPFSFSIDWVDCNTGGLDVEAPITYGDSGYEADQTSIHPGGGYWLWSNEDGDLIIPPIGSSTPPPAGRPPAATVELTTPRSSGTILPELTGQVSSPDAPVAISIGRESLATAEIGSAWGDAEQWQLAFTLTDGISSDSSHHLGVDQSASDQYDSLERHDPPGLDGLCNLWFESDWPNRSGSYRTDLRKPFADGAAWSFYTTAPANATLSWSQENGWQEGFAAVMETPAGRRIDLLAENSVNLTAAELASELPFRVFVGDEDYLDGQFTAREVSLSQSYPNPTTGLARIEFTLTEVAPVELAVYDLAGRRVALLSEGTRTAGRHAVGWDASTAAPGVYLYRLMVDGETVATKRLVVTR
ncbi:T9SS type A sorting domain-containing protein, partial [bacterium]|nr:T9SS type A sorting domain-containing protein [bacterium]